MKKSRQVTKRKSGVEQGILESLEEFAQALESGRPIEQPFNQRRIVLNLKPRFYDPAMVKRARLLLGASQTVFALFLGVSVKTVQAWEQGALVPNGMARRFMDEIERAPELHRGRLTEMAVAR